MSLSSVEAAELRSLPVAVIGAGPVGLAAAAHLIERDIPFVLLEAGTSVAASVREWQHVRLFSPWSIVTDAASIRLLEAAGWQAPDAAALPFGHELLSRYLEPLAALPAISAALQLDAEVLAVTREGADKSRSRRRERSAFLVRVRDASGTVRELRARAVIDASGTWRTPNPFGAGGLDPIGLASAAPFVSNALPDVLGADRARFAGKSVVVVGSGHSASNTLLALATLAREELARTEPARDELASETPVAQLHWIIRGASPLRSYGSENDELPARGALGSRLHKLVDSGAITLHDSFLITDVEATGAGVTVHGLRRGEYAQLQVDNVVAATGFRPDLGVLRELRIDLDEIIEAPRTLAPLIDPNLHSCGSVPPHGEAELRHPEADAYIVGMKSYGRAPTFLLATGYEQVRSVVASLAGDTASAQLVQLVLPETGVCSTGDLGSAASENESCCSNPVPTRVELSLSRP